MLVHGNFNIWEKISSILAEFFDFNFKFIHHFLKHNQPVQQTCRPGMPATEADGVPVTAYLSVNISTGIPVTVNNMSLKIKIILLEY